MKKRLIFPVALVLIIATIFLVFAIFRLYIQAEIQQRNIFNEEVQIAGSEVVEKIDALLSGDTILPIDDPLDSEPIFFQKFMKKVLYDDDNYRPIGVIKAVISLENSADGDILPLDTIFFDTAYRHSRTYFDGDWEADIDVVQYADLKIRQQQHASTTEMDSATQQLLNRKYLYRIVKETLIMKNLAVRFDFALYNSLQSKFVVLPSEVEPQEILKSPYFFSLKLNEKIVAPHYLIIYFPTERGLFLRRMFPIISMIAGLLLVILLITALTLYSLYRQKKISDMKNDFINNMTHELKTPISTISLACEALADENVAGDEAVKRTYISIIKDENDRLKQMVTNVLQIARLRKNQLPLNVQQIDIQEIITAVSESIALQISSKQGQLTLNLHAPNTPLFADPIHIENILINLIENAVKYADPNKSLHIEITTEMDKKHLILMVKDNGIGISKKDRKYIFDDFYRVSRGNLHDSRGYGLGLSYVKKIVLLHGGAIFVDSELKKWTQFTIYLPIKKQ